MIYLFLNSISTGEVFIILIFILMFFGSKNIPGMARTFGKALRQVRDATDDIKRDIRKSVDGIEKDVMENMKVDKDIKETISSFQKDVDNLVKKPKRFIKDNIKDMEEAIKDPLKPVVKKSKEDLDDKLTNLQNEDKKIDTKSKEDKQDADVSDKVDVSYSKSVKSKIENSSCRNILEAERKFLLFTSLSIISLGITSPVL